MLVLRDSLNLKELRYILGEIPDWLPENSDIANEMVMSTLKIKDKKSTPIESPRVLVIHPPYLLPSAVKDICVKYCMKLISLESAFHEQKQKKQSFEKYVRKTETLSNELQLSLIQSVCSSAVAKNKG